MKTKLLKEALSKSLEGSQVKAGLFTSYGFEPRFFENYIMPLLIPGETFGQNELHNNIRWRFLYGKDQVPPVTVYTDQYAKSGADAPLLDYTVHAVSMPGKGQNRGAFHPKISFVLAERNKQELLIVLCGSGNLTEAGWCRNAEAFCLFTLEPGTFYPQGLRDALKNMLEQMGSLRRKTEEASEAETAIITFFNKRNRTNDSAYSFYHSGQGSFRDFLQREIFDKHTVRNAEVFSPYFGKMGHEVAFLAQACLQLRLQAPIIGSYCALDEAVFTHYEVNGATWYHPPKFIDRWSHSKVYRFITKNDSEVITVIGSVNLTTPGWAGLASGLAETNMECALLVRERVNDVQLLLQNKINKEELNFLPGLGEGEDNETAFIPRFETPDICFTLDWTAGTLSWQCSQLKHPCSLLLPGMETALNKKGEIKMNSNVVGRSLLKALAKCCLLKVEEAFGDVTRTHIYYPLQTGFQQKPFPVRYSATDILALWDSLSKKQRLTDEQLTQYLERFTERLVDESGAIHEQGLKQSSLLNENARHLSSLLQLERYLFKPDFGTLPQIRQRAASQEIIYYLTANNLDTLPAYITELERRLDEGTIQPGFLFVLLTILEQNFYDWKIIRKFLAAEEAQNNQKTFRLTEAKLTELNARTRSIALLSADKVEWFRKNLVG